MIDALADRLVGLGRGGEPTAGGYAIATDTALVDQAFARAGAAWPLATGTPVRVPVAQRWCPTADASAAQEKRLRLWRGGAHVGADARAAAFEFDRIARAPGIALLELDRDGNFGAFLPETPVLDRVLDPALPPTIAAADAGDAGGPWLTVTLSAILATQRIAVILPVGAPAPNAAMRPGSAFAALARHAPDKLVCHALA